MEKNHTQQSRGSFHPSLCGKVQHFLKYCTTLPKGRGQRDVSFSTRLSNSSEAKIKRGGGGACMMDAEAEVARRPLSVVEDDVKLVKCVCGG